jgi:hypothetical protein
MDPLVLSELKRTTWINLCNSNDLILFKKKGDKLRGNLEFNTDLTSLFNVFISFPKIPMFLFGDTDLNY